ncbi:unnamed protein product [Arctogadus glacialis]
METQSGNGDEAEAGGGSGVSLTPRSTSCRPPGPGAAATATEAKSSERFDVRLKDLRRVFETPASSAVSRAPAPTGLLLC